MLALGYNEYGTPSPLATDARSLWSYSRARWGLGLLRELSKPFVLLRSLISTFRPDMSQFGFFVWTQARQGLAH